MNYWLVSLRPIRARPSQVGIKLGISVVWRDGPAGWHYRHHPLLPPPYLSCCSALLQERQRNGYLRQDGESKTTSSMMSWTFSILLLVASYSQAANGFRVEISEELLTENCQQTLTNLEVSYNLLFF